MKRFAVGGLLLFLLAGAICAQEITVAYVDGVVEMQDGSSWTDLYIGDSLSSSDQVRLGANAYLELSNGSTTVKLSREGTYAVETLLAGTRRTESAGVAGMVLNRIGRLSGQAPATQQTTAGGARASEAVNQNAPTWAGGETIDDLVKEGLALINKGSYQDAYSVFQEAYDYAVTDQEYAEALFYYGYASSLVDNTSQALDLLEEVGPDPSTDYYAEHVLALGQLLVQSFAYEDAVTYLTDLVNAKGQAADDIQSAQLLLGIAYDGMGMRAQARSFLSDATRTVPGSDAATAAQNLLANL